MHFIKTTAVAVSLLLSAAHAQTHGPDPDQAPAPDRAMALGSGPYPAVMEEYDSLSGQTIYRPEDLSTFADGSLPVVLWGNGACANQGNSFRVFLTEIASYGYAVIALGPVDENLPFYDYPKVPGAPEEPAPPPAVTEATPNPPMPPTRTRSSQMIEALDWLESSAAKQTPLGGHADNDRVAIMGMSCGGAQTVEAAADDRVDTAVLWNSGLFPGAGTDMAGGKMLTKADLTKMNGPVAYISGDASDIAFANAEDDVDKLAAAGHPVFRGWQRGVGHGGNFSWPNGGEFAGIAVAWLDWQLKDSEKASYMFKGEHCGLCSNPRWVTRSANLD